MMSLELLALIGAHFICNAAAQQQVLPPHKAMACSRNFSAVKVRFVGFGTEERFDELPLEVRIKIQAAGYKLYRDWVDANPETVSELRVWAQEKLSARDSGT